MKFVVYDCRDHVHVLETAEHNKTWGIQGGSRKRAYLLFNSRYNGPDRETYEGYDWHVKLTPWSEENNYSMVHHLRALADEVITINQFAHWLKNRA